MEFWKSPGYHMEKKGRDEAQAWLEGAEGSWAKGPAGVI